MLFKTNLGAAAAAAAVAVLDGGEYL